MRRTVVAAVVLATAGLLSACSAAVPAADVEEQITAVFEDQGAAAEDVSCPEDLPAEKGADMTCTASVDGTEYDVKVTVTSVEGDTANFDVEIVDPNA